MSYLLSSLRQNSKCTFEDSYTVQLYLLEAVPHEEFFFHNDDTSSSCQC